MNQDGTRAELADRVSRLLSRATAPGAAVGVMLDGEPMLVAGIGCRDLDRTVALASDARFPLYSITKPLLAAVALQLVGEGALALDAPLRDTLCDLLPELPDVPAITLRRLLNHTSGLPDYGALPAYNADLRADSTRPWTEEEFLARTLAARPRAAPGAEFTYSNLGYMLIRVLLEQVAGAPLSRLLAERLFAPLGLQRTFVYTTLADSHLLTPGFSEFFTSAGEPRDIAPRYHPGWVAHGLVVSTAEETAVIVDALFRGRLIPPALLAEMTAPVPVAVDHPVLRSPAYGLGLMLGQVEIDDRLLPVAGHGGGGPGYDLGMLHARDEAGRSRTAVALVNRDRDDSGLRLAAELLRLTASIAR